MFVLFVTFKTCYDLKNYGQVPIHNIFSCNNFFLCTIENIYLLIPIFYMRFIFDSENT